jgi:hypothetical protein
MNYQHVETAGTLDNCFFDAEGNCTMRSTTQVTGTWY